MATADEAVRMLASQDRLVSTERAREPPMKTTMAKRPHFHTSRREYRRQRAKGSQHHSFASPEDENFVKHGAGRSFRVQYTQMHEIFGRYQRDTITHEPGWVYPDLLLIPERDQSANIRGYSCNGYVLIRDDEIVLLDITSLPAARQVQRLISATGASPIALILSHRHSVSMDLGEIQEMLQIPIYLHPHDASDDYVGKICEEMDVPLHDPRQCQVLADFGLSFKDMPGHTPGSMLIRWQREGDVWNVQSRNVQAQHDVPEQTYLGDVLFVGDCAIGSGTRQMQQGFDKLIRPPLMFSEDDTQMRHRWQHFLKSEEAYKPRFIACIASYHGQVFPRIDMTDQTSGQGHRWHEITEPLSRLEPTHEL